MSDANTEYLQAHVRSLETALDRAFDEVAQHRTGLERRLTLPLICDLVSLHQMLGRYQEELKFVFGAEEAFETLAVEVLNTLARQGVLPIEVEVGQTLNRLYHRPVAVVPCLDPAEDLQITAVLRRGFASDDSVIVKAEVKVKRCLETQSDIPVAIYTGEA